MAKQKSGGVGGLLFNVFNIGFTVFMFILPTIGLVYWYLYIRDPGGGAKPERKVIVQEARPKPQRIVDSKPSVAESAKPQPPLTSGFFQEATGPTQQTVDEPPTKNSQAPPSRKEYQSRVWTDQTGTFTVEARFYSIIGDRVKIVADDDRKIEVPIAKLSEDDKEYLRVIFREKGLQPSF